MLFLGDVCPSPLLGVCPPCENCSTSPNKTSPSNTIDNTITNLPGEENVTGPNNNQQGMQKGNKDEPSSVVSEKNPLSSNLPKGYYPKHDKLRSGSLRSILSFAENDDNERPV